MLHSFRIERECVLSDSRVLNEREYAYKDPKRRARRMPDSLYIKA